jgi:hypothetical protein
MASAGLSHVPHLHFQIHDPQTDPFVESTGTTFWKTTQPYAGDVFAVRELAVNTETGLGFTWRAGYTFSNISRIFDDKSDSAKLHPPRVFGAAENQLFIYWNTLNRPASGQVAIRVRDPADSLFFEQVYTSSVFPRRNILPFDFGNAARTPQPGRWKIELAVGSTVHKSLEFTVGPESQYAPLFSPVAGLSFWIGRAGAYFLTVDSLSGSVTYTLGTQTNAFTLVDTVPGRPFIIVGTESDQPYRNAFFPVLATNATGYSDTFHVHVVDFSKPFENSIGTEHRPAPARHDCPWIAANPYSPGLPIRIRYTGRFSIFSIDGRKIREMVISPGARSFYWDGKDDRERPLPAGLLIFRLDTEKRTYVKKVVFLP